jgi:hypothetical protein
MLIRSVQQVITPEFTARPPDAWEARLREISPITDRMDHLRFRWRTPKEFWNCPEQGQWELYACTPRALADPLEVEKYAVNWRDLPTWLQEGRKSTVTDYQYYMWHEHHVEVRRFWILQGPGGGTPARYSIRERRYLDGMGYVSDPFPLGFFPACPFDERSVQSILERDRLVKACHRFDDLVKMDRPEALKAEDEAAERVFRETYLETWSRMMQPQKEYMKTQLAKSETAEYLPPAPAGLASVLDQWKDHYIQHNSMLGLKAASSRAVQVAVK